MRVVPDTNVIVSALIWGGMPYRLLEAAVADDIELYTSPDLMTELRNLLARRHLAARFAQQRSSVEQAVRFYEELAIAVSPLATPAAVPRDADDDHVVAAALAANSEVLVSGDRDLLSLGSYEGLRIVTVAKALEMIMADREPTRTP